MKLNAIGMSKEQAKEEWESYKEAVKTKTDSYLKEMKKLYFNLMKGRKALDIFEIFKKLGVNEKGEPLLAICRADLKEVFFHKRERGAGRFSKQSMTWNWTKDDVNLPEDTFPKWVKDERGFVKDETIHTPVPLIPAKHLPKSKLENYYILWEVKDWKVIPKDPVLLKRISKNMFIVISKWNLTPLERAVLRGRS